MGNCLSFGNGLTQMLWKEFSLDKASQHVYVKFGLRAAPISGSEPDTFIAIRNQDRTVTYNQLDVHTTPGDFSSHTFNLDFDLGEILPIGAVITVCFETTGAPPEPYAPCVDAIIVATDPII